VYTRGCTFVVHSLNIVHLSLWQYLIHFKATPLPTIGTEVRLSFPVAEGRALRSSAELPYRERRIASRPNQARSKNSDPFPAACCQGDVDTTIVLHYFPDCCCCFLILIYHDTPSHSHTLTSSSPEHIDASTWRMYLECPQRLTCLQTNPNME
jgi:hypothetical protein